MNRPCSNCLDCKPRLRSVWLIMAATCLALGCQPEPSVRTISLPLSKSGLPIQSNSPSRMVVAIARLPGATWFFKLTGAVEAMASTETQWLGFLQQVTFDDEEIPKWEVPDGWVSTGPRPGRYATLNFSDDSGERIELAISSLGPNFEILPNVNRWRGQLGLSPLTAEALDDEVGELSYRGGLFLMFDGKGNLNSSMSPPFAGANGRASPPPVTQPENGTPVPELIYDLPEGWETQPEAPLVALRIEKQVGEERLVISVTPMPARLTPWPNAVRSWIAETGSDFQPEQDLESLGQAVSVLGMEARRVDLMNLSQASKSVIGIRAEQGDRAWFIKLSGPPSISAEELAGFESFLSSLSFK